MPQTRFLLRHTVAILMIAILVVMDSSPSDAVVLIRNEQWTGDTVLPASPGVAHVGLSFDADLTASDHLQVRFSIGAIGERGGLESLVDFEQAVDFPLESWTAHFEVSFSLACDGMGQTLLVDPVGWMHYIHPVHGTEIREVIVASRLRGRPRGCPGFELVALDVGGFPSNSSWVIDATACSAGRKIGIYFDPAGTICQGTIGPDLLGTLYVVAKLEPGSSAIEGAEFRIIGIPASWLAFPVANPEIVAVGNPLDTGVTMAFPCYASDRERLVLYTVFILARTEVSDLRFTLEARNLPGNAGSSCSLLVNCGPAFCCLAGEPCFVNATTPTPCGEPTAVEPRSWSAVKSLYRQSR